MKHIEAHYYDPSKLRCPYCNEQTFPDVEVSEEMNIYEHVLFVAHDDGIEYINPKLNIKLEADEELPYLDQLSSCIKSKSAVCISIYQPAPVFFGLYVGFDK